MASNNIYQFNHAALPKADVLDATMLALIEIIRDGLLRDQHVRLHQFGTFRLRWTKARRGRNPQTGELMRIPPCPKVTFTPAKMLGQMVDPNPLPVMPIIETPLAETPSVAPSVVKVVEVPPSPQEISVKPDDPVEGNTESQHQYGNKKWVVGMLAMVPIVIAILQADFSEQGNPAENGPLVTVKQELTVTPEPVLRTDAGAGDSEVLERVPEQESTGVAPASETLVSPQTVNTEPVLAQEQETLGSPRAVGVEPMLAQEQETLVSPQAVAAEPVLTQQQETLASSPQALSTEPVQTQEAPTFHMEPQVHRTESGESLWKLAKTYYQDPYLWPLIFRANRRSLDNPHHLNVGRDLIIPGLQNAAASLSDKDRQLVSEGYMQVYELFRDRNPENALYFLLGAKKYHAQWLRENQQVVLAEHQKHLEKL